MPRFSHAFLIAMEDRSYSDVIGNTSSAPYINQLAATYGLATNYFDVWHPSVPNYLALSSGNTYGVTTECDPNVCPQTGTNLADELEPAGLTWHAYGENMGTPCNLYNVGEYVPYDVPYVYYIDIQGTARCTANVVDYGTATSGNFASDLAAGSQTFSWIAPNLCNAMHDDCGTGDPIKQGDLWLMANVPPILSSPAWKQNGVLFIVWDESLTSDQVAALVISPLGKASYQSATRYDHYSLLRTIEDAYGLAPLASAASASPMADFFR